MYDLLSLALIVLTLVAPQEPEPFSHEIAQYTFLRAKSARIYPASEQKNKVRIQVENLEPVSEQGLVLVVHGATEEEIEVTTLIKVNELTVGLYPPQYLSPNKDGTYIIIGKVGDNYGIRVKTAKGVTRIFATIKGNSPPPPVVGSLEEVTKFVKQSVTTLNDPITQSAIKVEIDKLLTNFPTELVAAKQGLQKAISEGLLLSMVDLPPPYKDWKNGFRIPLDNGLSKLQITNASQLKEVVIAISKGL